MARPKKEKPQEPLEKQLWSAADKLRKNIDAAEYKHVVLGLIFLKYISDAFEALHATLAAGEGEYEGADPEDRDEYLAQNIFFVPVSARWSHLRDHAKQPDIGVLLVAMLEPFRGRVMDPCCGSGGMFVQSEQFVREHQGMLEDLSLYGQESNQTTWRLAKMNLAIRAIDSSQVLWNNEGSFLHDAHPDVRVEYILANPPFNDSDWSGDLLQNDARWQYGVPPAGNANFAWMQHFIHHLSPRGQAGVVLAKGSLTSKSNGEGDIRRRMIEEGNLVDCIVNLPAKLFLNTQIPACLWFLARDRKNGPFRDRSGEILFIDARNMGQLINRRTRILTAEDIATISTTYHNWRNPDGAYEDVKGFCAAVPLSRVAELDYVLTPGRYVGLPDEEDDFDFAERFASLKQELAAQLEEEQRLNAAIAEALARIEIK